MSKLLTDQDFTDIRSAIGDVSETFLQKEITYKLFQESMNRMNTDQNKHSSYERFDLMGLIKWETTEPQETRQGVSHLQNGYVLFNIDALLSVTGESGGVLISDENGVLSVLMLETVDRIEIDGEEMLVTLVQQIGQLKDRNVMLKVFFARQVQNV